MYHSVIRGQKNTEDFLLGSRKMSVFPVTMSLMASFLSAITMLGTPAEVYVSGSMYIVCICICIVCMYIVCVCIWNYVYCMYLYLYCMYVYCRCMYLGLCILSRWSRFLLSSGRQQISTCQYFLNSRYYYYFYLISTSRMENDKEIF